MKKRGVAVRTRHHNYAADDSSVGRVITISEVADRFGVTLRALRFYEDKGLIQPLRQGAMRLYSHGDCARLETILTAIRLGFSLKEIKEMTIRNESLGRDASHLGLTFEQGQNQLARLQSQRRALDEAIQELTAQMVGLDRL